jgi:hypothetical protein
VPGWTVLVSGPSSNSDTILNEYDFVDWVRVQGTLSPGASTSIAMARSET